MKKFKRGRKIFEKLNYLLQIAENQIVAFIVILKIGDKSQIFLLFFCCLSFTFTLYSAS